MRLLKGRKHAVTALAFARGSNLLAAGGGRGGVHVWDSASGELVAHFDVHVERWAARGMVFMSDQQLFVATWQGIYVCDVPTQQTRKPFRSVAGWPTYHAGPDGAYLVATGTSGTLRAYRVMGKKLERCWEARPPSRLSLYMQPLITPDGTMVVSLRRTFAVFTTKTEILVHSLSKGTLVATLACPLAMFAGLAVDEGNQRLLGFTDHRVYVWDFQNPQTPPRVIDNPSKAYLLAGALHPTGDQLATLAGDRYVRVWDTTSLQLRTTLEWNIGKLHTVGYSADGLRAAVGSGRGTVLVWDVE